MVGLLRADDFLEVLDVLLPISQAVVGLRGEIGVPELEILVALEKCGVLISDPE